MRRRLAVIATLLLLIAGLAFFLGRPKPVPVAVTEVVRGTVESTVSNTRAGTVEACQRTRLSTILGGRIEFLGVREGDRVKKGQLLLKLWNDDQQANAGVAQAQLALTRRRSEEVCIAAANARREADRQSALREKGFVSGSREEAARTEAETREAACATSRADIAQAEARLKATVVEQGRTHLYAPFDGTVAKIVGELGEYSTPSPPGVPTPPAIDLIDESCLYIKAPMDEVDAPRLQPGLPVRITLDALPGERFAGTVRRIAPVVSAVEKQARTVDVEIDFTGDKPPTRLLVGYSADVEVLLTQREDTLRIPTAALQPGRTVLLLQDGKLVSRAIQTGLSNWEHTEVVEGLQAGDVIVTSLERPGVKAGAAAVAEPRAAR